MINKQVWLVTGAGRGMGTDIARAALDAGHAVVATGRDTDAVTKAIGGRDDLLVVRLDVTSADDAEAAVNAAVERFGHLDVLVNNAGNFFAGFFEELSPEQVEAQVRKVLFGTMMVTRAALPTMRGQRSGQVVSISSVAGLIGQEFCSAYAAAKFGVEGFIESLATEVEQFGIGTTIVEPGFFRTDLLTPESTTWAELSVDDYAEQAAATKEAWQGMNGQQGGDPAKLARAHRDRRIGRATGALGRRGRCGRGRRGQGEDLARADRRPPRVVVIARTQRRRGEFLRVRLSMQSRTAGGPKVRMTTASIQAPHSRFSSIA